MPITDRDEPMDERDLSRYWNAINAGETPPLGDLDPDLAATVRYLHQVGHQPSPDPTFLNRLGERIMSSASPAQFNPNGVHRSPLALVAAATQDDTAQTEAAGPRPRWLGRMWPVTELAAAVLLIVALGSLALTGSPIPDLRRRDPAGVNGNWTMFRGGPARTGFTSSTGPEGAPVVRWTFAPDAPVSPALVVAAGVAYVVGDEAHVYALDGTSGEERWRFLVGSTVAGVPALADGVLYVGAKDGTLYAIDAASGAERWRLATGGPICCSPVIAGDTLYIGNDGGDLLAIDLDGRERWRFHRDRVSWSSPSAADGRIFVGTDKRELYAIDAATGHEQWHIRTAGSMVPAPAIAGGVVYVGTWQGALYAIDAATGAERWRFAADVTVFTPAIGDGLVYAGSADGTLYALDATTGAERWRFATGAGILSPPAIAEDVVYIGSLDGYVYALDAATGAERWRFGAATITYGPVVADGLLYVAGSNGVIYAIGGGEPGAASTPLPAASRQCACWESQWRR